MALNNNDKRIRFAPYQHNYPNELPEVKDLLGFVNKYYTDFEEQAAIFARTPYQKR